MTLALERDRDHVSPMIAPLASLRRRTDNVLVYDSLGLTMEQAPGSAFMTFARLHEAEEYLRYWAGDAGAMTDLRRALSRRDPGVRLTALTNAKIIGMVAAHLVNRSMIVLAVRLDLPPEIGVSSVASTSASATVQPAAAATATASAPSAPLPPALPLLEEVQIEGAEVLPEVLQTLDQIDASMAQLDLATVSLEPAPSGVPAIGTAMSDASGSVTSTLDEL